MTVGIIDYLRQFDFMKRMESVGKSVGMIAGQASPTIIEPALYSKRFVEAMQRYFMPVASMSLMKEKDKQTTI
jgi:1-phosphatidylinositol-3-phosphate 5-kinase